MVTWSGAGAPMSAHIERVLDAARTAPSHDNLQPWRFWVDGDVVAFFLDEERSASPDGAVARIGLGAAIESACVAAARMGATVRVRPPREGALVEMSFSDPKRLPDPDLSRTRRVTNRRVYDGRPIDDETLRALREATPQRDLAQTHWFGRERVHALGPLMEQAEDLFWADQSMRERALAAIRFDVMDRADVTHGLSVACLDLSSAERAALAGFRKPVGDGAAAAARRTLAARARKQIESASGVCIVTTTGKDPMADVDVGRSMQRAWLALTQGGLAVQPMTAAMSLARASVAVDRTIDDRVMALLVAFRRAFPNVPNEASIATLLRFGHADAPSSRVGRLDLAESVAAGS